jgi:CP family cyanate transporter-like MFS transporter
LSLRSRRILAMAGIILVVLNLRPAITSLSPIYDQISQTFPLNAATLGVLGMLPPLAFAFWGSLTPRLISKLGLEKSLLLAMALVFGGQAVRSFTNEVWFFGITYTISLAGIGIGNVLIPPVIKSYFPDRIGLVTSIYAAVISVSAALPSLVAVPVTHLGGWRVSTGMWAGLALIAAVPWVILLSGSQKQVQSHPLQKYSAWGWPTAWAITILFGVGALNNYTMIAWLPKILTSSAGVSQASSGIMLSMYNLIGFPVGLVVPIVLNRTRRPLFVIATGIACLLIGYLGLAYLPLYAWVWIFPAGIGLMLVTIGLTLVNLRSHTPDGAAVLSGFTQGAGYLMGAVGPIVVAGLHSMTGDWMSAFWFLLITALVALGAGVIAARPRFIEDS